MSRCGLCVCVRFTSRIKHRFPLLVSGDILSNIRVFLTTFWCFSNRILRKKKMMLLRSYLGFSIFTLLGSRWAASAWSILWCCQKLFSNLTLRQIRAESKLISANQSRRSVTHDISKQVPSLLPMIVFKKNWKTKEMKWQNHDKYLFLAMQSRM